jgi:hypothetical protein
MRVFCFSSHHATKPLLPPEKEKTHLALGVQEGAKNCWPAYRQQLIHRMERRRKVRWKWEKGDTNKV